MTNVEQNEFDNNDVIIVKYKDLEFEIDMIGDVMMMDMDLIDLFEVDNVETQPVNLFFRRLIDLYIKNRMMLDLYKKIKE
jgi:hypothetical protein